MKEFLKLKRITQTEFAKRLGVSQRLVSYWCTKEREPDVSMIIKISQTLSVPIEQIVLWFAKNEDGGISNET